MLNTQQQFTEYMQKLTTLMQGSELTWDRALLSQLENTELLLPVIGAFSTGKSTLLNTFLGMDILPVGIAPETELATELHYGENPWLQAIRHDGSEERLPVEALADVNKNSADYSHLRLHIDNPALKAIAPLVLVDMPGYGSSLENHNKALAYYLPRGVHFIVVTSVEDGTVTQSMLRHLDSIKTFDSDFSFALSKTNLRAPEQVQEVSSFIEEQLQLYFDKDMSVIPLDNKSATAFYNALVAIDPERLFHNLFIDRLKDQNIDLLSQINFASNVVKNSKKDNDNAIVSLEQALEDLLRQRNRTQQELTWRYSGPLITRIINAIDSDLHNQLDRLAKLVATSNAPSALEREIVDIMRSNLTNTLKREMDQISADLVEEIAVSLAQSNTMMVALDDNWAKNIADKTEGKLKAVSGFVETLSEKFPSKEGAGKAYRVLSSILAITTNVLNPVLELAIVFLPDIIRFFSSLNAEEKARDKLMNTVFPGIKSELRKALPEIVDEQLQTLLNTVSNEFEEQINQQRTLISTYQQEREQQQASIDQQLDALQQLSLALQALATTYLYR